jgi:endonuclease G
MAKFRTNHGGDRRGGNQASSGMVTKVLLFIGALVGLYYGFNNSSGGGEGDYEEDTVIIDRDYALPTSTTGVVIDHHYFSLSYSEEHEQAEWVAYELHRDNLTGERVPRSNDFRDDPKVRSGSSSKYDFGHPDYDRGHMAPAGDMNFNSTAMSESFYMSNMSPQRSSFNQGIWRELEENTRKWAKIFKRLYVVTGPVLTEPIITKIGNSKVSVPAAYYKVLLDLDEPEKKAIGFIMPNARSEKRIKEYAVSVDEVEELTGIDFFGELLDPDLEADLEANFDASLWTDDYKKYQKRVKSWNLVEERRRN